ncbi:hypothetical protein E4U13_007030 [Claviceps humidiphila]|uniref:Uncharacterized protein n=1 Tax=Claviceps humidiphila TaxID=1294629 RepID=A0A9P7TS31_9HYPO|nr:hypothetical protein E4U13_007030 [Claviceps humidiphila]
MDQQSQIDALNERIRNLEQHSRENDTPSKQTAEALLPQEHDRSLQQNQEAAETSPRVELKDKEIIIQEKDEQIRVKDGQILAKDGQIEDKERQIQKIEKRKEEQFREYKKSEDTLRQALQEKEMKVQKIETALKEKEMEVHKKDMEMQNTLRQALQEVQKIQTELKDKLKVKEIEVLEKDMEMERKDIEMETKVLELRMKDNEVQEKNRLLEGKNDELRDKDRMLEERDLMLEEKDLMLEERDRQLRLSNFIEYIEQCFLSYVLTIEPNALHRTEIGVTKLTNRFQPYDTAHWANFLREQRVIFNLLCALFPSELRVFPRLITVQEIGSKIRPIASEKATEMFIHTHFEGPVTDIINMLHVVDPDGTICQMEGDLDFIYHPKDIDDNPGMLPVRAFAPPHTLALRENEFRPDEICVVVKWQAGRGQNILLFPCECKAPHNLTEADLVAVLPYIVDFREANKPAGISQQAWNSVRHALMQAYDYMIQSLSEFGILTTGMSIVFLHVDWASGARTLHHHLVRPAYDVAQAPREDTAFHSAVGQYVSFIVMALRQSRHVDQESRVITRKDLLKASMGSKITTKDAAGGSASTSSKSRALP